MKKIISLILVFIFLFSCNVVAFAAESSWEYDSKNAALIIKSDNIKPNIENEYPWAEYSEDINELIIGDDVTVFDEDVTDSLVNLESITVNEDNHNFVTDEDGTLFNGDKTILIKYMDDDFNGTYIIPDTVEIIGEEAFEDHDELTSIVIPEGVITIGDYAFLDCHGLFEIIIPDSVVTIGEGAFEDCGGLKRVVIGNGATKIGESAFEDCDRIIDLTIGANVSVIGNYAFYDCQSLKKVVIPDSVILIGEGAFEDGDSLETVIIGDGVGKIGVSAFEDCDKLVDVTIGKNVIKISDYAFYDCFSLTEITIPESVTTIGNYAFGDCYSLSVVRISGNLTSVGLLAFNSSISICKIYFDGSIEQWNDMPYELKAVASLLNATIYYNSNEEYTFEIANPSRFSLNYKDGIVLHTNMQGEIPEGAEIRWSANNKNFIIESDEDNSSVIVVSNLTGITEFTATLIDENGNVIAIDTVDLSSNAGFFQKI